MRHHLAVSYCLRFRVVRGYLCWELSEEQQDDEGSSSSSPDRMVSQGADLPGALEKKKKTQTNYYIYGPLLQDY